jgi:translation initiation factor 2 subunit 1
MSIDKDKGHVDLSLKRVNEHQKREKIKEWKNNRKATRLFEMLAGSLQKSIDDCYEEFGKDLAQHYGSLYKAFEETAYDPDILTEDGFSGDWIESMKKIAEENIPIQFVDITGYLDVKSFEPNGIKHIRQSLKEAEKSEFDDVTIEIHYIGAPHYTISIKAPDYKIAEEEMKKAVARVENELTKHHGQVLFHRKIDD